jgi:hypothetical protein
LLRNSIGSKTKCLKIKIDGLGCVGYFRRSNGYTVLRETEYRGDTNGQNHPPISKTKLDNSNGTHNVTSARIILQIPILRTEDIIYTNLPVGTCLVHCTYIPRVHRLHTIGKYSHILVPLEIGNISSPTVHTIQGKRKRRNAPDTHRGQM